MPYVDQERKLALCYIRISYSRFIYSDQNNDFESNPQVDSVSPERQRSALENICIENNWTPVWFEDVGGHQSGRDDKSRSGLQALEKRLFSDPNVAALVTFDLSRLHRKAWKIGKLAEELDELGVALIFAYSPFGKIDLSTQTGKSLLMILGWHEEQYANATAEKVRDSIQYRKARGISVGRPPFGTMRDDDGYLVPSDKGVWLMPDGSWQTGNKDENPTNTALWRGYYDCAKRILELYAEGQIGRSKIAYQIQSEGWPLRTENINHAQ